MTVIPVQHAMILPDAKLYMQTAQFREAAGGAAVGERVVLLLTKEMKARAALSEEDFYPIGVSGVVRELNPNGFVVIAAGSRVNIDEITVTPAHEIELTITKRPGTEPLPAAIHREKLERMKEKLRTFASKFAWGAAYSQLIDQMETIGEVVSALSVWMSLTPDERFAVLAEDSETKRTEMEEKILYENLEVARVTSDASDAQQKEYQDLYRESAIKKQMEYLQKELDELHPEKMTDVRRFEKKLAEAGMNETAHAEVLTAIIEDYTKESGVRGLRKRMDALCRGAAVMLAKRGGARRESAEEAQTDPAKETAPAEKAAADAPITITKEQLREELDMRPVRHEKTPEYQRPGVVTGLAWTSVGGEILYIETLFTRGRGNLIITGKLGDVMKESAQIAVSLVKAMFPEKAKLFSQNDLHIHVPEGAVPKDGPSAGVTMTTAIASLVTGRPIVPQLAMTGEVSLRGAVSAIGGLPEKLMAAVRAGVTHVLIPAENMEDLRDVPKEVREALTITPVADVEELLAKAGVLEEEKIRACA